MPPRYRLTVNEGGTGAAIVTSSPEGIECNGIRNTCSREFAGGTVVTLTGSAKAGWTFDGWSGGGCSGTGACQITLNSDTEVTAHVSHEGEGGSEEDSQPEEHSETPGDEQHQSPAEEQRESSGSTPGTGTSTASQPPAPRPSAGKAVSKKHHQASKKRQRKHVLKCRKGFKKRKVHGKAKRSQSKVKCVKVKKRGR